ncbi:Carboxy-terminal processing protease [hydrothermal vent metagenome]|uniref:Carboxy-terminal processing protease n=1 Tax=hydrothermal vent metagenome TaxID=652676 RepID=A0A3B0TVG5_9ZZZZ
MVNRINIFSTAKLLFIALTFVSIITYGQDVQPNQQKFARLLRLIDSYYVDSTNIGKLTEDAIIKVLSDLDPHSVYIPEEDVIKKSEGLKGNFEGIGISFNIFKDTLMVVSTIPGGPSEKVGLQAGDRIVTVDNKNIAGIGLKNSDVFKMLKGKKGTLVELEVKRRNNPELLDFRIIRDKIPIHSLDASYMLDETTGYIRLNKFSATTAEEFNTAITELKKKSLENLILDLRNNGGGFLRAAIKIADQFLDAGQMIVYTNGLKQPKRDYFSSPRGNFKKGKLVVLVNEGSASASEIVSGAIQDWDRGLIIGRRSFGKGLVQQPFFLPDGSMVRLTTAHYYTPCGRCIQKPFENGLKNYREDYMKRVEHGEMFNQDSINFDESQKFLTLKNKRVVYGGGGIMPDIFVPMDTSSYYRYFNKLRRNNIINTFTTEYVDKNRESLTKKFSNFKKFKNKFEVTGEMINELVAMGEKEGVEKDEESMGHTTMFIKKEVKALIARNLYTRSEFFQILNIDDDCISKALEVINKQGEYDRLLAGG